MKHRFFLIAFLFCCVLGVFAALLAVFTAENANATRSSGSGYADLAARFGAPVDPDEARRWRELGEIARKGPEALLNRIREEQTPAPLIYSKWFVDERIARVSEPRAEVELAKREFGRAWAVQMEEESGIIRALTTIAEHEAKARTLLDLADWIGSEGGYGNLWLFFRLQDLANISVGHLLSDKDYPMDSLERIAPRLLKNIDIYTKIGIHALNAEAPEPMFKLGEVKTAPKYGQPRTKWDREDDIQGPAFAAWHKNLTEATKQLRKTQKDGEYVGSLSGEKKRSRLPDDLQFFIDDEDKIDSRPFTAVEQWDVKFHYKILLGLVGDRVKDSLDLLEFRRRVGTIPEPYVFTPEEIAQGEKEKADAAKRGAKVVPFWEIPDFDAREFAFEKAWKALPGLADDDRNNDTAAYQIFKLVQENKLYDDDYETMLHHNHDLEWKAHVENQRRRSKELEEQDKKDPVYLKYVAAKNALNAARGEVGRAEDAIHELPYNSGGLLDSDYLFLLRDRKYKEAEAALEKSRRNLRENTREEELLLRKAAAIRKMVEAEQTLRETEAEYKAYKAELDEKRKRESIEETEAFFREHGIQ